MEISDYFVTVTKSQATEKNCQFEILVALVISYFEYIHNFLLIDPIYSKISPILFLSFSAFIHNST